MGTEVEMIDCLIVVADGTFAVVARNAAPVDIVVHVVA